MSIKVDKLIGPRTIVSACFLINDVYKGRQTKLSTNDRQCVLMPAGSPSLGGDVTVDIFGYKQDELAHSFFLSSLYLFLCLCPFQLYFTPEILTITICFPTLTYFCLIGSPRAHLHVVGMLWLIFFSINQPSLLAPFYSVLVSIYVFMALSTVFHSINSPDNSPLSHSVLSV